MHKCPRSVRIMMRLYSQVHVTATPLPALNMCPLLLWSSHIVVEVSGFGYFSIYAAPFTSFIHTNLHVKGGNESLQ